MTKYTKGRRKEYKIVKDLKKSGFDIAQRTAGSHSPFDVIAIRKKDRKILLVQSKRTLERSMDYIDPKIKEKLEKKHADWEGQWDVEFEAR